MLTTRIVRFCCEAVDEIPLAMAPAGVVVPGCMLAVVDGESQVMQTFLGLPKNIKHDL